MTAGPGAIFASALRGVGFAVFAVVGESDAESVSAGVRVAVPVLEVSGLGVMFAGGVGVAVGEVFAVVGESVSAVVLVGGGLGVVLGGPP